MFDQLLFKPQFNTGQTIRLNTPDGVILDSCDANIGVLQGKARKVPAILCDGADDSDQWQILNIVNSQGMFLDHVAIKGAVSQDQAHRLCAKYLDPARSGQVRNQVELTPNALKTFLDSANTPNGTNYLLDADAPLLEAQGTIDAVLWDDQGNLISHRNSLSMMMLDMAGCDIEGAMLERVTPRDVLDMLLGNDGEALGRGMFDAMIIKYNQFEKTTQKIAEALKAQDNEEFFVKTVTPIEPFKRQGVVNVGVIFEMSDTQTITVLFNNPDTTPAKLTGTDILTSWKWLLNKRDVTAVLQPRAVDARKYPQLATRMMKLLAKNHDRFKRAQMARSKDELVLEDLIARVEASQSELSSLQKTGVEIQQQIDAETQRKQQQTEVIAAKQAEDEAAAASPSTAEVIAKFEAIISTLTGEHGFTVAHENEDEAGGFNAAVQDKNGYSVSLVVTEGVQGAGLEYRIASNNLSFSWDIKDSAETTAQAIAESSLELDQRLNEVQDATQPEDYAKIIDNDAQLTEWQDPLDSFFQTRLIDTRNALRGLGWAGERFKDLSKDGHTLIMDLKQVGAGANVVGVTYRVSDTDFSVRDDLSLSPEDLAARIDQALVPSVNGDEFGEFEGDAELRKAVQQALEKLVGEKFPCPALNAEVEVRTNGIKKIISKSADIRKLQAIAALKELLENATKTEEQKPYNSDKERNIKAYHILHSALQLNDELLNVRFVIREDDKGHYHYDHKIDSSVIQNAKSPLLDGLNTVTFPMAGVSQDKLAGLIRIAGYELEDSIESNQNNVNAMLDSVSDGLVLNMFIEKENQAAEDDQGIKLSVGEFVKAKFAKQNKLNNLEEYRVEVESGEFHSLAAVVQKVLNLSPEAYDDLTSSLLSKNDQYAKLGGTLVDDDEKPREEREYARIVVAVMAPGKETILIDPQGYEYARYVGLDPVKIAVPKGFEDVRIGPNHQVIESDEEEAAAQAAAAQAEFEANNTEAYAWIKENFADLSSLNTLALARYIVGYDDSFNGQSETALTEGAKKLNAVEGINVQYAAIKTAYENRNNAPEQNVQMNKEQLKSGLVRTYYTQSGKIGAEVKRLVHADGRISYSYNGEWGAGSISPEDMQAEEDQWKAKKRGYTVVEAGEEYTPGQNGAVVLKAEAEEIYRMLDYLVLDYQGHTADEFKRADVPGRFKQWLEKAEAVLQRKFRNESYRAEIERSIERANETIARWKRVNAEESTAAQTAPGNADEQFLNDVIAGNVDLLAPATGDRIEQIGDNLDPALESLFEQAIDAYSAAAIKNAQSMG